MLIEDLKQEHAQIAEVLGRVKVIGITSKKGQTLLSSARQALLGHLKKEDERLYPVLRAAAEHDEDVKRTMNYFTQNMQAISETASDFFDKYENGGSSAEFAEDFSRLFYMIKSKISKEESILYELYQQVASVSYKASA